MGSGDWFKTFINLKKVKVKGSSRAAKSNGFKSKNRMQKESSSSINNNAKVLDIPVEDLAATRIQTAFRAYMARKALRRLKGAMRLRDLSQAYSVKKQATTTLKYIHSWSNIQAQITARRQGMVTEGRLRQKKLEHQLKLEAKLHDLEVEWSGGPETMEETLARIHQKEEASVKRERAMAYAFSHQWRANSSQYLGFVNYELGKANWGWSWMDRWIAARPWERRVPSISPKHAQIKQGKKGSKSTNTSPTVNKTPNSSKTVSSNGKGAAKPRRLSYPPVVKGATMEGGIKEQRVKEQEANSNVNDQEANS